MKVCCIQSEEEAQLAIRLGADCLGLVGEMPSGPGPIGDEVIRRIARSIPAGISSVLLTSRVSAREIVEHVRFCETSAVQLVDEAVEASTYETLRSECPGVKIVQVLHVEGVGAIERAAALDGRVDAILLDSGLPSAEVRQLGGTGQTHDWSVSGRIVDAVGVPVFLAGGLNAGNVGAAIRGVGPFGVDLCSGVRSDGRLDDMKLEVFMRAVSGAR